jgi:hypothetical protein
MMILVPNDPCPRWNVNLKLLLSRKTDQMKKYPLRRITNGKREVAKDWKTLSVAS